MNEAATKQRANYLPAPAYFKLNHACQYLNMALGSYGCYLVGSSMQRPDYRDVDVRFIMENAEFDRLFPGIVDTNPTVCALWSLLCTMIADWMTNYTGLPVDFQIQRQSAANNKHPMREHPRSALGTFLDYPGGG